MKIPVLKQKKPSIVAIGSEDTGYIYLQKLHHCVSGERLEIDEYEINQMQGQVILDRLARKIVEDKGISRDRAMSLIFPKEEEVEAQKEDEQNILLQYPEEMEQLVSLRIPANKLKAVVATVFIQRRVAYPVQLTQSATINSVALRIAPTPFPIPNESVIKFDSCLVKCNANHDVECETLAVEPISTGLAENAIGYLYDPVTKREIVGADWAFEQTNELDENLIELIYEFYQREKARLPETPLLSESSEIEEGKQPSQNGKKSAKSSPSNGKTSTGESSLTGSQTPDLLAGSPS